MDVHKALADLYEEKKHLDAAIGVLELRLLTPAIHEVRPRSRRGRRSMSAKEREEVSMRMSRYWAARRALQPSEASRVASAVLNGIRNLQMIHEVV